MNETGERNRSEGGKDFKNEKYQSLENGVVPMIDTENTPMDQSSLGSRAVHKHSRIVTFMYIVSDIALTMFSISLICK